MHAQALLKSTPQGATDYLPADLRDPGVILRRAAEVLDFGQPAAGSRQQAAGTPGPEQLAEATRNYPATDLRR